MENPTALLNLIRAGLPSAAIRERLEHYPDPATLVAAGIAAWRGSGAKSEALAQLQVPDQSLLAADMKWLEQPGHHLIGWHDPNYPDLLRRIGNPPPALFVAGDPDLLWHAQIAVVGSRHASAGGRDNAGEFARVFARSGFAVTSGLAQGIDTAAHRSALEHGRTIAVVATGLDLVFPKFNHALAARIAAQGAVVSEHPPGTPPLSEHFPSRNRIIAGLSLGTLVVEAADRSGALITARLAGDAGREVFALPGSIHNPMARGCHRLLRQGACLVESPAEVIEALAPLASALADSLRGRLQPIEPEPARSGATACPPIQAGLWRALGHDPASLDQLSERTGLTVAELAPMLLGMELDGRISADNGRYARRP
jgi:DNA processing protein